VVPSPKGGGDKTKKKKSLKIPKTDEEKLPKQPPAEFKKVPPGISSVQTF